MERAKLVLFGCCYISDGGNAFNIPVACAYMLYIDHHGIVFVICGDQTACSMYTISDFFWVAITIIICEKINDKIKEMFSIYLLLRLHLIKKNAVD